MWFSVRLLETPLLSIMSKKRLATLAAYAEIEDETDRLMAECFDLKDVQEVQGTTSSSTNKVGATRRPIVPRSASPAPLRQSPIALKS